jgi:flagellar basal-body rod protein FlgG
MIGMETKIDTVANNLANMNTTGFKKQRCNFEDLFYDHLRYPGIQDTIGEFTATGISVGLGTKVSSIQSNFKQGAFEVTERELDVAIAGDGFFRVTDPYTGNQLYTRAGNFSLNPNGNMVLGSGSTGYVLEPAITIPADATQVEIADNGEVWIQQPPALELQSVGQIELTKFINPEGLLRLGENLFQQTDSSGPPIDGNPGDNEFGTLKQRSLEMSNVEPVNELIDMITTQRAYELNSQVVKTGDELLQTVTTIKR